MKYLDIQMIIFLMNINGLMRIHWVDIQHLIIVQYKHHKDIHGVNHIGEDIALMIEVNHMLIMLMIMILDMVKMQNV